LQLGTDVDVRGRKVSVEGEDVRVQVVEAEDDSWDESGIEGGVRRKRLGHVCVDVKDAREGKWVGAWASLRESATERAHDQCFDFPGHRDVLNEED
jgi:hypothetical protein